MSGSVDSVSLDKLALKGVPVVAIDGLQATKVLHLNQDYNCICCRKKLQKGQLVTRVLEKRGMELRPRIQKNLKNDEKDQVYYYKVYTGRRLVHITCVAHGTIKINGNIEGGKNWTDLCAETESMEKTHACFLKILNVKIRQEKRLKNQLDIADEQWKTIIAEIKELWKRDEDLEQERKELESECSNIEKKLSDLKIMKWICAEWAFRLCMSNDRPITEYSHPYNDWYLDIGKFYMLDKKAVVDSKFLLTHDIPNRASFYEQEGFFRKRVCGFVDTPYLDENPHLRDLVYEKYKRVDGRMTGGNRIVFWKRNNYTLK